MREGGEYNFPPRTISQICIQSKTTKRRGSLHRDLSKCCLQEDVPSAFSLEEFLGSILSETCYAFSFSQASSKEQKISETLTTRLRQLFSLTSAKFIELRKDLNKRKYSPRQILLLCKKSLLTVDGRCAPVS